jgi:hypothetical protein
MRLTPTRIAAVATAGLLTAAPSLAQQPRDGGRYSVAENVHQRGARVEIPAGTAIPVILDQEIPVERGRLGDVFDAHVKRDVVVDGKVVIPSGAPAKVKLVESGDTPDAATVRLSDLRVDGEMRKVTAGDARADTDASGLSTGEKTAVGAAAGAIVGAVSGAGVLEGAVVGAGGGLAWGLLTERGREIDDGTSLRFELKRDLETR